MSIQQKPIPGRYYINLTGQMIKVRAILYFEGSLNKVVMEYLDGGVIHIDADEWDWLDLSMYNEWNDSRLEKQEIEKGL